MRWFNVKEMEQFNLSARTLMYNGDVDGLTWMRPSAPATVASGLGNACVAARNLLRARLGARLVQITVGGSDSHANIYRTTG